MKKIVAVAVGLVLLISCVACSAGAPSIPRSSVSDVAPGSSGGSYPYSGSYGGQNSNSSAPYPTSAPATAAPRPTITPTTSAGSSDSSGSWSSVSVPGDRMVVRRGNMRLVVSDVPASMEQVVQLADGLNGYIVSSQKWKEGESTIATISIRVPSETYDKAMSSLRALALDIINETTTSTDVTEEYVDLGSRLTNLQASETQLLKIMETAVKTEDVISVQRELTNVRGQIEQTKGRLQYLERTTSTSLIEIRLEQAVLVVKLNGNKLKVNTGEKISFTGDVSGGFSPYSYEWNFGDGETSNLKVPAHSYEDTGVYTVTLKVIDDKGYTNTDTRNEYITVGGGWNPGSVASSAWSGFSGFGRGLVNVLIWIGIFSPVWIVIGGIIWLIVWRSNRKKKTII